MRRARVRKSAGTLAPQLTLRRSLCPPYRLSEQQKCILSEERTFLRKVE
jgi:hypothetical protein